MGQKPIEGSNPSLSANSLESASRYGCARILPDFLAQSLKVSSVHHGGNDGRADRKVAEAFARCALRGVPPKQGIELGQDLGLGDILSEQGVQPVPVCAGAEI